MQSYVSAHQGSTRIHAVILTRNRTDVLQRCVNTALATLGPDDALTVLDDSFASVALRNVDVLGVAARRSKARLTHVSAEQAHEVLARESDGRRAMWQFKTAPRDIAPLRNVSLLLSVVCDAQSTVLIDDDIDGFDLDATHRVLDSHERGREGVIIGAEIGGTTEQDTLTRLADAMRLLQTTRYNNGVFATDLFRVPANGHNNGANTCTWASAGYLAFRLPTAEVFAFPPGYNEDWLWCLLHNASGSVRLARSDQAVVHDPPFVRRSSRDDILFELGGDLVFDCLAECSNGTTQGPEAALAGLAQHAPDRTLMPSVRTEAVLNQARRLSESGNAHILSELEGYGLSVLGEMQQSGELKMDGVGMLSDWSGSAMLNQRSFATTLETSTAQVALRAVWQKGEM
jgi:hypothetical protein